MTEQATVLYNFSGLPESGEITLHEGEVVTVKNKNIGEGWWEGVTADGRSGLFPEAYVQLIPVNNHVETSMAPGYVANGDHKEQPDSAHMFQNHTALPSHPDYENDDDYDDWDEGSSVTTTSTNAVQDPTKTQFSPLHDPNSLNLESKPARGAGSVGKNFNRFSSFVKHGGESYILGKAEARVRQVDEVRIDVGEEGPHWKKNEHNFTCTVEDPKQQSKLKGLKKFICYDLTPSDTAVNVQRRYKQFDWLYARLVERFPIIAIPRLPDKQASGRFEEDFIEGRMARLQLWISYICRHPVLAKSQLFRNFVTLTEPKAWKMSKRQAEKDQLSSGNFFLTISLPTTVTMVTDAEAPLDLFKKTTRSMDEAMLHYSTGTQNMSHKYTSVFKKEYQSFAKTLGHLATSFGLHDTEQNRKLTTAIDETGKAFHNIGEMFGNQPKEDFNQMTDLLWLYKGLLDAMPELWQIQTGAMRKVKECRKLTEEGKMTEADCGAIAERADRVVCCMRSEIDHFHEERIRSFTLAQRDLIQKQVQFFEGIVGELKRSLIFYDEVRIDP